MLISPHGARTEAAAICAGRHLGIDFERAIDLLFGCRGRVLVTGMGKSGIICRKIASTLSSTGTPAFFLHPAEATHGDLGALRDEDVVIAMSRSGETEEVIRLLESIRRIGARLIAITGEPRSTLGKAADVTLDCGVGEEPCPFNLAPTASTPGRARARGCHAMTLRSQGCPGGFSVANRAAGWGGADEGRAGDAAARTLP